MGVQFEALFDDGLFFDNARHANVQAMKIKRAFEEAGIPFLLESFTNQQFPILTQEQRTFLLQNFSFEDWQTLKDGRIAVRFCTSWATTDENADKLIQEIKKL